MSLTTVARKYAADTHRTKAAWLVTALFVVVMGFVGWNAAWSYDGNVGKLVSGGVQNAAAVLVPLVTVALGHGAVAGARESGTLRVLLAQPHSRRDVVAGAFLGRLLPIAAAVAAGLVTGLVAYAIRAGQLPATSYLVLAGFVLLWTLFGTSLAIGVSALVSTGRRAVAGGLGSYVAFLFVWDTVPREIVKRTVPPEERYPGPEWAQLVTNLDPVSGYVEATNLLVWGHQQQGSQAFYETLPFLTAVVAGWTILPMALALWRFPRVDL